MKYIGDRGGGSTSVLAYVDYFSVAPGNGWKALAAVTEFDIFKLRRSGAIPAQPRVLSARGVSQAFINSIPDLNGGVFSMNVGGREYFAIGPQAVYYPSHTQTDTLRIAAMQINSRFMAGAGNYFQLLRSGGLTVTTILGISYCNGEIHAFTGGAVYSMPATAFEPAANNSAASNVTATSYPATGLTSAYTQMTHALGTYLAWSSINGAPTATTVMRYSANNRATFTLCTQPGLNVDGGAAGGTISWALYDPIQALFIAVSVYGEILTSPDAITWTKSYTRTSGGTTHGLVEFCTTKDGRLLAVGTGCAAGQFYEAASIAGPWTAVTVAISGKTFSTRAKGVGYTAGVRVLTFDTDGSVTGEVSTAYSIDEGLTYQSFAEGGNGTMSASSAAAAGKVLTVAGLAVIPKVTATPLMQFQRLTTDFGQQIALPINNDFYTTPLAGGTQLQPYMKVA